MSFHTATTDDRVVLFTSHGTLIASQRMELARQALEEKVDFLLWLDSDMRFPKETIGYMMSLDRDIVAANYATRRMPIKPVAMMDGGIRASAGCIPSRGKRGCSRWTTSAWA
jgi:hypothetical protein